ncbi:MAG: GGDEF domain-containing protein [Bdellovibrionales bacterium]|nr:GGDEF domain-containing protein [Bdellovibrionales bacterium]MBT3526817.1 GGDEF domain-containing protein [Bdellovibrionales bacterium]MBT7765576.1 GGDEF domain-containing protein [Bdellovibrionales bacterium]
MTKAHEGREISAEVSEQDEIDLDQSPGQVIKAFTERVNQLTAERDQAVAELEKLKVVVDNIPCTISWIDNRYNYLGVNKALSNLANLSNDDYVGKQIGFKTNEDYFFNFCKDLFSSQRPTLYRELISGIDELEKRYFWVIGSKYAEDKEAVVIGVETTELKKTEAKLAKSEHLVEIDDLTGLYNMRSVFGRIEKELTRSKRFVHQTGLVMMDMDRFKSVNDDHNHLFGSFVLQEIGKIIKSLIREVDIGARYGGDEFLLLITEVTEEGMRTLCERLRRKIETTHFVKGQDEIYLTSSIGYAMFDSSMEVNVQQLVKKADIALYQAKERGRNLVVTYTSEAEVDSDKVEDRS